MTDNDKKNHWMINIFFWMNINLWDFFLIHKWKEFLSSLIVSSIMKFDMFDIFIIHWNVHIFSFFISSTITKRCDKFDWKKDKTFILLGPIFHHHHSFIYVFKHFTFIWISMNVPSMAKKNWNNKILI